MSSPARRHTFTAALIAVALAATACSSDGDPQALSTSNGASGDGTSAAPEDATTEEPTDESTDDEAAAGDSDIPQAPEIVRGVYSTVYSFWGEKWDNMLRLVRDTELNAVVVDVKDEAGTILWYLDHPLAEAGGGHLWQDERDPKPRIDEMKEAGAWLIARVACFKDTLVAKARPDLAVQDSRTGTTWVARKDFSWLNPYQDDAGQWCIDVGLAALEMGFDEVQFDYIRFPNGGDGDTEFISLPGVPDDRPREEWRHTEEVVEFLARASEQIHAAGGVVSADLFGLVTYDFSWDAQGTGQVIELIAEHVDFISPMVYPSHYGPGNYGLYPHPIEYPYETVWNAMQEAQMRVQGLHAQIRPWLEDFSAPWMGYPNHTRQHIEEQIRATYENGIEGWMLWNAANVYTEEMLAPGEAVSRANPDFVPPYRTADPDAYPGGVERTWPGHPDCEWDRPKLFIGTGNLANSTPPDLAPGYPEPVPCVGDDDASDAESDDTTSGGEADPDADPPADDGTGDDTTGSDDPDTASDPDNG